MSVFLGIDTSNYTTSAALYNTENNRLITAGRLLPVKEGVVGLQQSEAVFHHVRQLSSVIGEAVQNGTQPPDGVGVSIRPRDEEGSYMPCFLVGDCVAQSVALLLNIPCHTFSHQAGHIAAALYSAGKTELFDTRFLAFHLSGGTTEAVLVEPGADAPFQITLVARSLDLKAGQAVDRVGRMLGLAFPAGPALEQLALQSRRSFSIRPPMKGADCSLSGIENRCMAMHRAGEPACDVAYYCLCFLRDALLAMTEKLTTRYGHLPLVYAGGVMSNSLLRSAVLERFPKACFAVPALSCDNAAGVAWLASRAG